MVSPPEKVCRKVLAESYVSSFTLSHARSWLSTAPHSRQKAVRGFLGEVVSRKNPKKCTYLSGKKGRLTWRLQGGDAGAASQELSASRYSVRSQREPARLFASPSHNRMGSFAISVGLRAHIC